MNQLAHRPARAAAIARENEQIDRNVATIQQQRPTAIQSMAGRLNLSPAKLQETLRQTVFREANDAEFAALVVVANEYKLNPLLKEIFAFKAKGGGIIPYVSVDGWIRIINEHPQFDGIEFDDIVDEGGNIEAIECVIYRKDRSRPIKVVEYLDECRRDTESWKKSPKRFLRHRALMQCGRVAFGFSGIGPEDDYEVVPYAPQVEARNVTPPTRQQTAAIDYDPETGEIDEDTERQLDAQTYAQVDGYVEGPADEQRGEAHNGTDPDHPFRATADDLIARAGKVELLADLNKIIGDLHPHREAAPEEMVGEVDAAIEAAKARLTGKASK